MVPLMPAGHLTNVTGGQTREHACAPCDPVSTPGKPRNGLQKWGRLCKSSRLYSVVGGGAGGGGKVSRPHNCAASRWSWGAFGGERGIRTDYFLAPPLKRKTYSSDSWNFSWLRTQRITRSNTLFICDALFRLVETFATWGHAGIYVQDLFIRFPLSACPRSCNFQPWLHIRVIWGTWK